MDVHKCERCPELVECREQIVNGVGNTNADLVIVGEAPGNREDEGGEPFVGRSGELLDDVLHECEVQREDIRITNCIRCSPPGNRNPSEQELSNCYSHLVSELEAVEPKVVLALGKVPSEHLLDENVSVVKGAGRSERVRISDQLSVQLVVCPHPAYILRAGGKDNNLRDKFASAVSSAVKLSRESDVTEYM